MFGVTITTPNIHAFFYNLGPGKTIFFTKLLFFTIPIYEIKTDESATADQPIRKNL